MVYDYLAGLQQSIVAALEQADGKRFSEVSWTRPEGGGGITRVIEAGNVFERGGVNLSRVRGSQLPPSASAGRPHLAGQPWEAMGDSLVLHPHNPYGPTVHFNNRFFSAGDTWWFGGGMDLTPYYGFEEDARHFHGTCRQALAPFGADYHPRFKQWCDQYFHLKHRNEPRGVGGIFFDDLAERDFDFSFRLARSVGDAFLPAYLPILERRRHRIDPHVHAAACSVALRLAARPRFSGREALHRFPEAARLGMSERHPSGFTLLEVLVVVAIVAILALMAIPSYQDRLVRDQIVEALPLADIAKKPIAAAWTGAQVFPEDNGKAGLPPAEKVVSNFISSLSVEAGAIHMTFGNRASNHIKGKVLTLRPAVVEEFPIVPVAWVCGFAEGPVNMTIKGVNRTDVSANSLPRKCRSG